MTQPIEIARAALEQIRKHPETHYQREWRCATGMCFAGWYGELDPSVRWLLPQDEMSKDTWLADSFARYVVIPRSTLEELREAGEAGWFRDARTDVLDVAAYYGESAATLPFLQIGADEAIVAVGSYVQARLGLNSWQADDVFSGGNDLTAIEEALEDHVFNPDLGD